MFVRRDRRGSHRFFSWQVGLFFLAAGVWVGGMIVQNSTVTGGALLIAVVGMLVGMVGRRGGKVQEDAE